MNKLDELKKRCDEFIQNDLEYWTQNADAGEAFAHCINEGDWLYHDGTKRLRIWCESYLRSHLIQIRRLDAAVGTDELDNAIIDACEIVPGHIFSTGSDCNHFHVAQFPVGEIETWLPHEDLYKQLSNIEQIKYQLWIREAYCAKDFCDAGWYNYTNTDDVWIYRTHKRTVAQMIEWLCEHHEIEI